MIKQKIKNIPVELSIETTSSSIRVVSDWVTSVCSSYHMPDLQVKRLMICLNEVVANIIEHGGESARLSPMLFRVEFIKMNNTNKVSVTSFDAGVKFNPLQKPPNKIAESLEEAEPGGLGLTMITEFVDDLHYEYIDNRLNQLTFSVYWSSPQDS